MALCLKKSEGVNVTMCFLLSYNILVPRYLILVMNELTFNEVLNGCLVVYGHERDWYRVVNVLRTCYTRTHGYSLVAFKQLYLIRERERQLLMYSLD